MDFIAIMRWGWRQLTSMRTALILLILLGVAAIPGSLFPQRSQNPQKVDQYFVSDPTLAHWMDRFKHCGRKFCSRALAILPRAFDVRSESRRSDHWIIDSYFDVYWNLFLLG